MYSYLIDTIVLIFLGYAVVYPLFLWITPLKYIDAGFYRFNLGMCCVVGALGVIGYHGIQSSFIINKYIWIWFVLLLIITAYYWNSNKINNFIISMVSLFGCFAMIGLIEHISPTINHIGLLFVSLLGSMITACVFFAMILGHWYLNVISLPIKLLKKSIVVFTILLLVRITWDAIYLNLEEVTDPYGISYSLLEFTLEFEGFLLLIALFMGNFVPIVLNYFIWKTLKLQATQSATGLIYVSVVSILFGDLIFKFYLLQFGFLI